jgi:nucleoside 2-deoxyribosyltransferase
MLHNRPTLLSEGYCQRLIFDYEAIRADDIYTSGLIIKEITQSIQEASIIIADITPNNPNVYYEVGYAHALNKPTILLSDKTQEKLPFDVSGFRTLFYENSIGGKRKVQDLLTKHLQSVAGQYP